MSLILFLIVQLVKIAPPFIFSYDALTLYDGDSTAAPILGKYCGLLIPASHVSSNNEVLIHFKSDSAIRYTGFQMKYHPRGKEHNTRYKTLGSVENSNLCYRYANHHDYRCNHKQYQFFYCNNNCLNRFIQKCDCQTH